MKKIFLLFVGLCALLAPFADAQTCTINCPAVIKPPRFAAGNTVALVSPAGPYTKSYSYANFIAIARGNMNSISATIYEAPHMSDVYAGYLAGTDAARADDINNAFSNSSVNFILANRGGYGCNRILGLIDYENIKANPKIIQGYSDVTALINAIHIKTVLITFYGPMAIDSWTNVQNAALGQSYNTYYSQQVLTAANLVTFSNPAEFTYTTVRTLKSGKASGKLIGGNLSVFVTIVGTEYMKASDWAGAILFLEETGEAPYSVDRLFAALELKGVLDQISGFVWGTCSSCTYSAASSQSPDQVIDSFMKKRNIPAYAGAMIGHTLTAQFTLPIGAQVEIDADLGTIRMLTAAVL
jgi:muramoyltetrapeptide carboxypeptidase